MQATNSASFQIERGLGNVPEVMKRKKLSLAVHRCAFSSDPKVTQFLLNLREPTTGWTPRFKGQQVTWDIRCERNHSSTMRRSRDMTRISCIYSASASLEYEAGYTSDLLIAMK